MLGDTIDIKKDERKYNQLLGEGMLPSAAIRRIENEKRLGIGVGDKGDLVDWDINIVKIAVIGLGLFIGYSIIKKIVSPTPGIVLGTSSLQSLTIDDIPGIDLIALNMCREQGLI